MKRNFDIVTLSECAGCSKQINLREENSGMSPVEIILGGYSIVQTILGWFGGRHKMTSEDWYKLFPGSGYWTVRLRDYLAAHIGYLEDLKSILAGSGLSYLEGNTQVFVHNNLKALSGGKWENNSTLPTSQQWQEIMQKFYQILADEKAGVSTGYKESGVFGEIGLLPLLLLGGLAFGFLSSPTKKRKSRS